MGHHKSRIKFFDSPSFLANESRLIAAINEVASINGMSIDKLIYYFVPREKIIEINVKHLEHNYATDIITFDYCEASKISGELFICPDVVVENAKDLNVPQSEELHRVVFHGLLHLMGFNDKTEDEILAMRQAENKSLELLEGTDV